DEDLGQPPLDDEQAVARITFPADDRTRLEMAWLHAGEHLLQRRGVEPVEEQRARVGQSRHGSSSRAERASATRSGFRDDSSGSSGTKRIRYGSLYPAMRARANWRSAGAVTFEPGRATTKACRTSPIASCGIPTTAVCTTSGWVSRKPSTSAGK